MKNSILILFISAFAWTACDAQTKDSTKTENTSEMEQFEIAKSEEEWKNELTDEQYYILRQKGTERAFTGKYWDHKEDGSYACAGCGTVIFTSNEKYDSHCGWPSFTKPAEKGLVVEKLDRSHGMTRTEILCATCGGHLGHVFNDGPMPLGTRYCINSGALEFENDSTNNSNPK